MNSYALKNNRTPRRLLVNADDLGLSSAINTGIIQSHAHGIVTSTSMVASGHAFDEAVDLAKNHSDLGVGVHLTLVEERPVSPSIPVLPQTYGKLMRDVLTGRIKPSEIELEFRAQIEKCLKAGIKPTHLDSHQHAHTLPVIFPIVVRLCNEYGIRGIRIPRAVPKFRDRSVDRFLGKCVLCILAQSDAILFPLGKCVSTDRIVGLFDEQFIDIVKALPNGTSEMVCHPGCNDPSPRYSSWNARRQRELTALTSPSLRQAIEALGIELINYRRL